MTRAAFIDKLHICYDRWIKPGLKMFLEWTKLWSTLWNLTQCLFRSRRNGRNGIKGPCSESNAEEKRRSGKELIMLSLHRLFLSARREQKNGFPGSPNMVRRGWGVQQMSHGADSHTPLSRTCVQDRDGGRDQWDGKRRKKNKNTAETG